MSIRVESLSVLWYVIVRFKKIKTIILCKVIQGHLGAKNCLIMLVFITTSSDIVHHS